MANQALWGLGVKDLIDRGFIHAPTKVFGTHLGKKVQAVLQPNGTFLHQGNVHNSPSVAAGRAITAELHVRTSGRSYWSVNGWRFWHVTGADGQPHSLAALRELISSRES
jgi:hypothetical protein